MLLVLVIACVAAGPLFAEPDYKKLKAEIPKLEKTMRVAQDAQAEADQKLDNNRAAQKRAAGKELEALKTAAKGLAKDAGEKADQLAAAQQDLAKKQAELRGAAAKHAVSQLNASGDLAERVHEAMTAMDDWKDALGRLPDVPKLRSLDGIEDPAAQKAIRKQDKQQLEAYESWCSAEAKRIDTEIEQAEDLVDGETKVSSADDGALLVTTAKDLKKTLESRKDKLEKQRKQARKQLDEIG